MSDAKSALGSLAVLAAVLLACKSAEHRSAADEAEATLSRMVSDVEAAFKRAAEGEGPPGSAAAPALPGSTPAVPGDLSLISGKKFQANPAEWEEWSELRFMLPDPQWCQYQWIKESDTAGKAVAKCDPDGNGSVGIHYEWMVTLVSDVDSARLVIAPKPKIIND